METLKNIYLFPAKGPSRIKGHMHRLELSSQALEWREAKHIYITSSDRVEPEDWFCNPQLPDYIFKANIHNAPYLSDIGYIKKIVLSTDPILVEDGVQQVEDEFLWWLIENPCEHVNISTYEVSNDEIYYTVIIPDSQIVENNNLIEIETNNKNIQGQIDCLQGILDKTNHLEDDGPTRYFVLMELQSLRQKINNDGK